MLCPSCLRLPVSSSFSGIARSAPTIPKGSVSVFTGRQGIGGRFNVATREQATTVVFQAEGSLGFALAIGNYNIPENADTVADVAVGIPGAGRSQPIRRAGRGRAVVYFGGPTLLSVTTRPRSALTPRLRQNREAWPTQIWNMRPAWDSR